MSSGRFARNASIGFALGLALVILLGFNADYLKQRFFPTEYKFGKNEMLALLQRANRARPWTFTNYGKTYELLVELRAQNGIDRQRAGLPELIGQRAFACGSRTFYQTASACFDTTQLAVIGTITAREIGAPNALVERASANGHLTVLGTELRRARLELRIGEGFAELLSSDARQFEVWSLRLPQATTGGRGFAFSRW